MAFVRTILAALISVSIVFGPTAGEAAISKKPVEMSMADQADMPCCPPVDDSKGSVACAFKCLNFTAALFPAPVVLSHIGDGLPSLFAASILHGHVTPPIHPPPI